MDVDEISGRMINARNEDKKTGGYGEYLEGRKRLKKYFEWWRKIRRRTKRNMQNKSGEEDADKRTEEEFNFGEEKIA